MELRGTGLDLWDASLSSRSLLMLKPLMSSRQHLISPSAQALYPKGREKKPHF